MRSNFSVDARRTMPCTSYPCSSRSSARYEPSWPVIPVISARLFGIRGRLAGRRLPAGPARVRPVPERPEDAEVAAWADEMARHVAEGPEIYRPGAFWSDLLERNLAMLRAAGLDRFKR